MTDLATRHDGNTTDAEPTDLDVDVAIVGAGIAGLYLLKRLRDLSMSTRVFETGDDVGGTWYWNRYPGARCDVESLDYSYTWDPELDDEWTWSERYATQPEILRYVNHVADKHDLRRDITFETRITSARWDDASSTWTIQTDGGESVRCRHYVMATGCLSAPKDPDIDGIDAFSGPVHVTGRWPHEGVDFTGQRVAVIGTGSSSIQSIPHIAAQASELVVFQRTPNFSLPARNGPPQPQKLARIEGRVTEYREEARWSSSGVPRDLATESALAVDPDVRTARYERAWQEGTIFSLMGAYNDLLTNADANETAAEFVRSKIRDIVDDPATADALCPKDYPVGTKRLCLDTDYYATYNEPHVSLVDLRSEPISRITETGLDTAERSFEFDSIVLATGFDAMTGAIVRVDIEGRNGVSLKTKWADGPRTYLGLMTHGFPNLFTITGPQSPSVLSNMAVSIEQHVEWIADTLAALRDDGLDVIEPTRIAEDGWIEHATDFANLTLYPKANSWYMGANVPGKPRVILPYLGGVGRYRQACTNVVEGDYMGFRRAAADGSNEIVNEDIVYEVAPDVMVMLDMIDELGLPPLESMSPTDARGFMEASRAMSPPGPEVGAVTDGVLPGAAGDLAFRSYAPPGLDTDGSLPLVAYFHGGGWVIGNATSDDAFCRDLCVRTGAVVVSVDYRHGPEARFPAAVDDARAALTWLAANAGNFGADPSRLAVAGWSAGANLAGGLCHWARDHGGPALRAQMMVTPVTDSDMTRPSYTENGEGLALTRSLMEWFMDNYADETERLDPRVALLRAESLSSLPPAVVVTAEFDPLRDEGNAYAAAMSDAGVDVTHIEADGQIHTSLMAVNALMTPTVPREQAFAAFAALL